MALLTKEQRQARFNYLGLGTYNKTNLLKFQKKAFPNDKSQWDSTYGINTDRALRHFFNVRKVTKDFAPEEFKCECGGRFCTGYPNYMKQVELKNLQAIRDHFKKPVKVTCGLRCTGYNKMLNGSITNSLHLVGRACDINISGVTESLAQRKKAINWMRTLPNTNYVYGNGYNSKGYSVYAPYMGSGIGAAIHYDTNKAPVKKEEPKKSKYYSDTTMIGQACSNEKGSLQGGAAGDQKGGEVCITKWGSGYGWLYVFRIKDEAKRDKLAQAMIDTCKNDHIGYDTQKPDRYTAWDLAEKNGHDIKGIAQQCETTCSQAVSMCLRAVGIPKKYAPRHSDIAALTKALKENPNLEMFTSKTYTQSTKKLLPGDILLSSHHTAIVVKSPNAKAR